MYQLTPRRSPNSALPLHTHREKQCTARGSSWGLPSCLWPLNAPIPWGRVAEPLDSPLTSVPQSFQGTSVSNFSTVPRVGGQACLQGSATPPFQGAGSQRPQTFCELSVYIPLRGMKNNNQWLCGTWSTKTRGKFLPGPPRPSPGQKVLRHECWRAICLR